MLLSGQNVDDSLRAVGRRIAEAFELRSVELTASWRDSDPDGRALPIVVSGDRAGTLVIPRGAPVDVIETIERRVLPALETLLAAARQGDVLEAQVVEADALRRSDVVKTAILRSVSHDLRSPLTAITAAAGGLASPTLDAAARAELVSIIGAESDRLTRLVDNLLDLSRIQSGDVKPHPRLCTAEELIRDAVTSVGAPERVLEVECDRRLPPISVDGGQVERALANVIENAVRYTPDEGRVRVDPHGPVAARAAEAAGFANLFNGKDLSGWEGLPGFWSVRDGAITGQTTAEKTLKANTFLVWQGGEVKNCELRLSFRLRADNTDPPGLLAAPPGSPQGMSALVLGAGRSARATGAPPSPAAPGSCGSSSSWWSRRSSSGSAATCSGCGRERPGGRAASASERRRDPAPELRGNHGGRRALGR